MRLSKKQALKTLLIIMALLVGATLACVRSERPPLTFTPDELPDAQVGRPYEIIIEVFGNETPVFQIVVSEGELPEGLLLEYELETSDSATLSGVPVGKGEYEFTIKASCLGTNRSGQIGEQQYILLVND